MPDNLSLDLHGHTWSEALTTFIESYNGAFSQVVGTRPGRLDVVHGYGSSGTGGVLRVRLRAFLQRYSDLLEFLPGEQVDRNPGHTIVVPLRPLPDTHELLVEQVWAYCTNPRSVSKITGTFRRYRQPEVLGAIRELEAQRRLRALQRGAYKLYEAM